MRWPTPRRPHGGLHLQPGATLVYMRGFFDQSQRSYYRDGLRNGYNAYDMTIEPYGLESLSI